MSINVYGTSHVSEKSLELIEEKIDQHDPKIVALELDFIRLNALLDDKDRKGGPIFLRLIKMFQDFVGSQTGVMPGEEMLFGYRKSVEEGREVALIDQDITVTVQKLKEVRTREKIKVVAQLILVFLIPGSFDFSEIPDEEFLDQLLFEFRFKFPEMYDVLVEERNRHMAEALRQLQEEKPEADIVAFVGAAHRKAIEDRLGLKSLESYSKD